MTVIKASASQDFAMSSKGLLIRLAILALSVSAAAVIAGWVGTLVLSASIATAIIAWIVCLVSTLVAHALGEYPRGNEFILARMAIQMVLRSVLPLLVAIWGIYFVQPPLEKSLVFYMILFYLVGLVVDVQLNLLRLKAEEQVQ